MNADRRKKENHGVAYGFLGAAIGSLWSVLIHQGVQNIAPITFTAIVNIIAFIGLFTYAGFKGKLRELQEKKVYGSVIIVTLFSVLIPPVLIAIGSRYTSGINTSMLLLTEMIYTVIFTHFIGEKTTLLKVCGAFSILIGAILIIYKGNFDFNKGDIIIALAPITYPIASFHSKKALHYISTETILVMRHGMASIILFILARIFESQEKISEIMKHNWPLLVFFGIIILAIGKNINYQSFKRLDISKFISINMTAPFFSLIALTMIFHEKISTSQWMGIIIMAIGACLSIKRISTHADETMYRKI